MASQAEMAKLRVAHNRATALASTVCRKVVCAASFGKWFSEGVEYIRKSDLETALRRRDFKEICRVLSACDQEKVVRRVVEKLEEFFVNVLQRKDGDAIFNGLLDSALKRCSEPLEFGGEPPKYGGEVILRAFVIYGANKEFAAKVLSKLMAIKRYPVISELVETAETEERKKSCLRLLEENLNLLVEGCLDPALRTVRKHTKNEAMRDRIDKILDIDVNIRRTMMTLFEQGNYETIVTNFVNGRIRGGADLVLVLFEWNILKVIASGDEAALDFVSRSTQRPDIRKQLLAVHPKTHEVVHVKSA